MDAHIVFGFLQFQNKCYFAFRMNLHHNVQETYELQSLGVLAIHLYGHQVIVRNHLMLAKNSLLK